MCSKLKKQKNYCNSILSKMFQSFSKLNLKDNPLNSYTGNNITAFIINNIFNVLHSLL